MTTQAYFQNIRKHIKEELSSATQSIFVAVAWFTDKHLFKILCDKAQNGVDVQLIVMDDKITRNSPVNYEEIERSGGKLYLINESFGTLMHNKFCVIDEHTVITGSYNWSIKATANHENITVTKDANSLALTFSSEFKRIKETYHGKDSLKEIDYSILNKRLSVIDGLIHLQEYNDILLHLIKLKEFELPVAIKAIVEELEGSRWVSASILLKDYFHRIQALIVFDDVRIEELKWQVKYLELEIVALESEKVTIEKIISDFMHHYTMNFGELITAILKLKSEKLQALGSIRYEDFRKSEEDYWNFKEEFKREKEKDKGYKKLSDDEKDVLKKKYRKAASMCHPDVIANKFPLDIDKQRKAEDLFKKLNDANSNNDLYTVSQILENLENGIFDFQEDENRIDKCEVLEARINYLREKLSFLRVELNRLKSDKSYIQILAIDDIETFYLIEEERLKSELNNLANQQ